MATTEHWRHAAPNVLPARWRRPLTVAPGAAPEVVPVWLAIERACRRDCPDLLRAEQAVAGLDVEVRRRPPDTLTVWTRTRTCPHGRRYWLLQQGRD